MAYIWDIILCAIIALCVALSVKRGFIGASKNIAALILTVILLSSMQPTVLSFLQSSSLGDNIKRVVSEHVTKSYQQQQLPEDTDTTDTETSLMICGSLGLPEFMESGIKTSIKQMSEIKNNVMEVITDAISLTILKVLSMLILFVMVRIFVFLILKILESLFELPGLRAINRTMGAFVGIFNAILAVYIICGAVSLLTPVDKLTVVQEAVNKTYILKYFYDNNLLLSLFV